LLGENAVPVVNEESIRMIARERLPELLQGPFRGRVGGHVVMENSTGAQLHDHEYVKRAERGSDHNEEVARSDHLGMVMDEG
jgi:hypothetical protein